MSFYREQTVRMIEILKESGSINVVHDFYAQLSRFRPIDSVGIINALDAPVADSSTLVRDSITARAWMSEISLQDIRNHVVFSIYREFATIVDSKGFFDDTIQEEMYKNINRDGPPSTYTEELGTLLETCFYIHQICALKEIIEDKFDDLSIVKSEEWDMYHYWLLYNVNTNGLKATVYENFKLIEPTLSQMF